MALFEKALEAKVMSTKLLIRANVSKAVLMEAYAVAKAFEARYSAYRPDSFLNRINASSGRERVACTEEDLALFARCIEASKQSDGAFDITIGALSHGAYHFGFANQGVASEQMIKRQKALVGFEMIDIDEKGIFLPKEGMRLDLGGIGKGYTAGKIARFLREHGATKALVDVGGEIVCFGKRYTVALKDPFGERSVAYIRTSEAPVSISTSGDYERYIGSRKHHHILDCGSGRSAEGYSSMTIMQNGFDIDLLDAHATAMFNKDAASVRGHAKKLDLATIAIDGESNLFMNNIANLQLDSITFTFQQGENP